MVHVSSDSESTKPRNYRTLQATDSTSHSELQGEIRLHSAEVLMHIRSSCSGLSQYANERSTTAEFTLLRTCSPLYTQVNYRSYENEAKNYEISNREHIEINFGRFFQIVE